MSLSSRGQDLTCPFDSTNRMQACAPALLLAVTLAPLANVHAACWIVDRERPTTADQLPIADARVAGVRAAARAMIVDALAFTFSCGPTLSSFGDRATAT